MFSSGNFSKKLIILCGFMSAFVFWGCSNDHNFIEPETVVSLAYNTDCLDQIEPDFKLYKKELLSNQRLEENFQCLRDALDYVKLRVEGAEAETFTSLELKRFLNKILFKDEPKTDSFYTNLILVKSQFFGGDADRLSFKDFDTLKSFLTSLETTAKVLQPFASELLFESTFENKDDVDKAIRGLMPFLDKWVNYSKNDISIKALLDLTKDAGVDEITSEENWISVFNLAREVESSEKTVFNKDKNKLIGAFEKYYASALNLNRTLEKDWEYKRKDFFDLSDEVKSLLRNIDDTLMGHPKQKWLREDLVLFMNIINDYEVFDQELRPFVRAHVVDVLFGKWFSSSGKNVSLNSENLRKIELIWNEIDTFIVDSKEIEGYRGKTFPFTKEGTSAFALFTQQRWPSLVRKDRTLFIPDYEPVSVFTFQSLFHNSWQFAAAKILVEAYTGDEERLLNRTGLSIEEVEEAYLDVFVFLKEIEFLSEESRGGWFRIFNEGNIFVPSADPDGYVSISETADYAAYMFSAVFTGDFVEEAIGKVCPNFVEKCSFNYARKNPEKVFSALPGLVDYFNDLGEITGDEKADKKKKNSFRRWQKGFEYIAKLTDDDSPYIGSHWFRGTVANQYNEVIFRKYDTDGSDSVNFEEVSAAFVDFKEALKLLPQVKGTSAETDDAVLKSFLTLFVKKGRLPKLRNGRPSGELIRHVTLCGGVDTSTNPDCVFESDRSKIMTLLAFLTSI